MEKYVRPKVKRGCCKAVHHALRLLSWHPYSMQGGLRVRLGRWGSKLIQSQREIDACNRYRSGAIQ